MHWLRVIALSVFFATELGCGEQSGIRVIIHLPIPADGPAQFGVVYADGSVESFDDQVPQSGGYDDPLVLDLSYGPDAVNGPAQATFTCRPDPPRLAYADFVVDLEKRVTVEMTLMLDTQ